MLVALAGIHDEFVPLLTFLGNFMPPIAGTMIVHFLLLRGRALSSPFTALAVLAGGIAGYAAGFAQLDFPSSLVALTIGAAVHYFLARHLSCIQVIASPAVRPEA